jgi:hypothetical protein
MHKYIASPSPSPSPCPSVSPYQPDIISAGWRPSLAVSRCCSSLVRITVINTGVSQSWRGSYGDRKGPKASKAQAASTMTGSVIVGSKGPILTILSVTDDVFPNYLSDQNLLKERIKIYLYPGPSYLFMRILLLEPTICFLPRYNLPTHNIYLFYPIYLAILIELNSSPNVGVLLFWLVPWVIWVEVAVELLDALLYIKFQRDGNSGRKDDRGCVLYCAGSPCEGGFAVEVEVEVAWSGRMTS